MADKEADLVDKRIPPLHTHMQRPIYLDIVLHLHIADVKSRQRREAAVVSLLS